MPPRAICFSGQRTLLLPQPARLGPPQLGRVVRAEDVQVARVSGRQLSQAPLVGQDLWMVEGEHALEEPEGRRAGPAAVNLALVKVGVTAVQ